MILEALSKVEDVKDFRLKDTMHKLGLDHRQPSLFYRRLILEAREMIATRNAQHSRIARLEREKRSLEETGTQQREMVRAAQQWKAAATAASKQIAALKGDISGHRRRADVLEIQVQRLEQRLAQLDRQVQQAETRAQLHEDAWLHLLGQKPVILQTAPEGWLEVVLPEFKIPGPVRELVICLKPGEPSIRPKPYDLARLLQPQAMITYKQVTDVLATAFAVGLVWYEAARQRQPDRG